MWYMHDTKLITQQAKPTPQEERETERERKQGRKKEQNEREKETECTRKRVRAHHTQRTPSLRERTERSYTPGTSHIKRSWIIPNITT